MMNFVRFLSLHPALTINVLIAAVTALALWLTRDPAVLLALVLSIYHTSQQVASGVMPEAVGDYDDDEPAMGFTAKLKGAS
jgi:Na+/melibiose symporter-like transporter